VAERAAAMWQLVQGHAVAGGGAMIVLGVISLVVTVLLLPIWVARLPADHFSRHRVEPTRLRTLPHVALRAAKNTLGAVLVFLGLLMLVLPGQGLLTILIGVFLVELPGKRAVERRIARQPVVRRFLDGVRVKHGAPPLILE
jgi:hypothetical protein